MDPRNGSENKKNLTAEVTEHAEIKMAKSLRPGCRRKSGPISNARRKVKNTKGLSKDDLCDLCFLFVHPLVFIPGGSKGKEESISIK
jgi:hypothetical protein